MAKKLIDEDIIEKSKNDKKIDIYLQNIVNGINDILARRIVINKNNDSILCAIKLLYQRRYNNLIKEYIHLRFRAEILFFLHYI